MNNNNLFLLEEIVKKNFSSKYKDSFLGIFWTILRPLLMMGLFTIIFSTLFGRNIENFPVYFLCGWCIVTFFNNVITTSMYSLKSNKNILQRTTAPKHIFVLGSILSEGLNLIITLILLLGVMFVTHAQFHLVTMPFSIITIMSLVIMVTGLGLIFSIISVYYTDIQHLWTVLSMFVFYASAVFYPMDIIPEPYHQYLIMNPIFWAVDQFRCFVYQGIAPNVISLINFLLLSLIILICGIIVFKKYEDKVVTKF